MHKIKNYHLQFLKWFINLNDMNQDIMVHIY